MVTTEVVTEAIAEEEEATMKEEEEIDKIEVEVVTLEVEEITAGEEETKVVVAKEVAIEALIMEKFRSYSQGEATDTQALTPTPTTTG